MNWRCSLPTGLCLWHRPESAKFKSFLFQSQALHFTKCPRAWRTSFQHQRQHSNQSGLIGSWRSFKAVDGPSGWFSHNVCTILRENGFETLVEGIMEDCDQNHRENHRPTTDQRQNGEFLIKFSRKFAENYFPFRSSSKILPTMPRILLQTPKSRTWADFSRLTLHRSKMLRAL